MSSRTPGADSGTGTLAAFRLPRESGSPAGSATRPGEAGGGGEGELVPGTGDSGPGRGKATPCRAPRNSVRVARHRAELRPRPRGSDTARAAILRGTKAGAGTTEPGSAWVPIAVRRVGKWGTSSAAPPPPRSRGPVDQDRRSPAAAGPPLTSAPRRRPVRSP